MNSYLSQQTHENDYPYFTMKKLKLYESKQHVEVPTTSKWQ